MLSASYFAKRAFSLPLNCIVRVLRKLRILQPLNLITLRDPSQG